MWQTELSSHFYTAFYIPNLTYFDGNSDLWNLVAEYDYLYLRSSFTD